MAFDLDGYVDVAERITAFYAKFPDGRLTRLGEPKITEVGGKLFVQYTAKAYRTPDDPVPAIGTAWEPFPGPTKFTKDSELMNAETSAWGRAIVAAGVPAKKIASREEVRNRLPQEPRKTISEAEAKKLYDEARAAGVPDDKLQRGASHYSQGQARKLDELTGPEALELGKWIAAQATKSAAA
jgi:hypothetical protein